MNKEREHPGLKQLKQQFNDGKLSRREFIRYSTLLGVSATAAYGMMGMVAPRPASAADMPKGGTVRISMRVLEVVDPHTYSWLTDSNQGRGTHEYLTKTGTDNVTRPYLAEKWEATEDLKTWTLNLQKIKWHNGRDFTADDVIWNINHCLDPNTGSSVLGLMKGYMLEEYETGEKDDKGNPKKSTRLWDANAIEKVDDHTVRLNLKAAQVAVPEHLFHYPFAMLDPEEGGKFGPGSNGTGPYPLVEQSVGERAVLRKRDGWWGGESFIDELQYVDLGDDPSATMGALASQQVHGNYAPDADITQFDVLKTLPHLTIHEALTAQTAVARIQVDRPEFQDPRVRKAFRLAVDTPRCLEIAHRNIGAPGEHHHVCPVHPDYKKLPFMQRDVEAAKKLLAEAGHPNGIDVEIASKKAPAWELQAVQTMVEQWKDAGIRVKINVMPSAQFWDVLGQGALRLHVMGAPPARLHGARARLPLRCAVERVALRRRRVRHVADPGGGDPSTWTSGAEILGQIEMNHAGTRADHAAAVARHIRRVRPTRRRLQAASDRLHLRRGAGLDGLSAGA